MFTQFKHIDTAFKYLRTFIFLLILACVLITGLVIYKSDQAVRRAQTRIYILANGKAIEAFSADRKDNIPVEARDHIKMFHRYFFGLDPDEKVIRSQISSALNLADESAKKMYDNLKEQGFYTNLIAANLSQEITVDSIQLDMNQYPYYFRCQATQHLIRSSSMVVRKLLTQGYLRNVARSDNNPHGFLIQKWEILENMDVPKPHNP